MSKATIRCSLKTSASSTPHIDLLDIMTAQDTPPIELTVNGRPHALHLDPKTPVLMALRQDLDLKGTRLGCMEGYCGACTVLIGGRPVQTCNLAIEAVAGENITTIEAAAADESWRFVRQAFLDGQAAQCGYCTNGIIMTVIGLLGQNPPASRQEIIAALDERHLCRCGAQLRVLKAIDRALAGGSR
jgi:aerobic-type carbon monoxide dehydrogenase small subunit (CoxS/CutS family)